MYYLLITGQVSGRAHFFERIHQQGRRTMVPTYHAELGSWTTSGPIYRFSVVRDVSDVVFGKHTYRFGYRGECPPNRPHSPYRGFVDNKLPRNGWGIRIYEPGFTTEDGRPNRCALQGQDSEEREHVILHRGPGGSAGCMMIAGGKIGLSKFQAEIGAVWISAIARNQLIAFIEIHKW